ncbi:MAG: pyridoxamine 5'-phosphate oxidase family protein [Actinomycetota bacterium]
MRWGEFAQVRPDLASATRALLYQFGVGLGFLATVRGDGGPRVHPMCPVLVDEGLFAFIVPSPKRQDLVRDTRYALHSFPRDDDEDAVYLTGVARARDVAELRTRAEGVFCQERELDGPPEGFEDHQLFELLISGCLLTRTTGHGDPAPDHTIWKAT